MHAPAEVHRTKDPDVDGPATRSSLSHPRVLLLALIPLLHAPSLLACGHCAGDRAAAVYSYKNLKLAERRQESYSVVAVQGAGSREEFDRALNIFRSLRGVRSGTVRAAFDQRAISFVHSRERDLIQLSLDFQKHAGGMTLVTLDEDLTLKKIQSKKETPQ